MKNIRTTAIVVALIAAVFVLIGYAGVVRDQGSAAAGLGYAWLLFTAAFAIVVGAVVFARPQDQPAVEEGDDLLEWGRGAERRAAWNYCPSCGARMPHTAEEAARCAAAGAETDGEDDWEDDYYDPRARKAGAGLLWLGVLALNVLFVLLVIWLFVPHLAVSQKLFMNMGGSLTPGILVMDLGAACVLVGHSLARWA